MEWNENEKTGINGGAAVVSKSSFCRSPFRSFPGDTTTMRSTTRIARWNSTDNNNGDYFTGLSETVGVEGVLSYNMQDLNWVGQNISISIINEATATRSPIFCEISGLNPPALSRRGEHFESPSKLKMRFSPFGSSLSQLGTYHHRLPAESNLIL